MARLIRGAETSISMAFLVMCVEKILRLIRLFFVLFLAWVLQPAPALRSRGDVVAANATSCE